MVVLALVFFVILAIAAPILGYDSRVVDADRPVRWWPGERGIDVVSGGEAHEDRHARADPPSARRQVVDARAA